jgi:hypothetical protein
MMRMSALVLCGVVALALHAIAVSGPAQPREPKDPQRYEYAVRDSRLGFGHPEGTSESEETVLNAMARDGWELVEVATSPPVEVNKGPGTKYVQDTLIRSYYFCRPVRE